MTTSEVSLFARKGALAEIQDELVQRVEAVLRSGRFILGEEGRSFEQELAEYVGREHCVGVANGTDALMIALLAAGVRPGDDVVVPAVTFFATAEAVAAIGARPVFADVEPDLWTVSVASVEAAITSRTKALLPVDLFGNPAPMKGLEELGDAYGIPLLEDAAQAVGAELGHRKAGSFGAASAFSFYPGKNLGAVGDAGAIVTDDERIAHLARALRDHGSADKLIHTEIGFNSRLDEVQAAALRVALPHLEAWTSARRAAAAAYRAAGLGEMVGLPGETPDAASCFHLYVIRSPHRERIHASLAERGIETRVYYTPVLPDQPAMREFDRPEEMPGARGYGTESLALPMGESLSDADTTAVVAAIRDTLS